MLFEIPKNMGISSSVNIEEQEEFLNAVNSGNLEAVQQYIDRYQDLDYVGIDGNNALVIAVKNRDIDMVKLLVLAKDGSGTGIDVNKPNEDGETAYYTAVVESEIDIAEFLRLKGARINDNNESGSTPLNHAIKEGNIPLVRYLIHSGVNVLKKDSITGESSLYVAAKYGYVEIGEALLLSGVGPENSEDVLSDIQNLLNDSENLDTMTPLLKACKNRHVMMVKMLIAFGASPNKPEEFGNTPLHILASDMESDEEYINRVQHKQKLTREQMLTKSIEKLKIAIFLIDHSADVNLRNAAGSSPLDISLELHKGNFIKMFIENDAYIRNIKNEQIQQQINRGWTPKLNALYPIATRLMVAKTLKMLGETSLESNKNSERASDVITIINGILAEKREYNTTRPVTYVY